MRYSIDYRLIFKSYSRNLYDVLFLSDGKNEFFLYVDAVQLLYLIIENLKRVYGAQDYQVGDVPDTPVKNLRFSDQNIYQALHQVMQRIFTRTRMGG
ncbi:MAG: hypothetical protein ACMUEM_06015 [Flavobacteriales bacterium AspAUS03]